MNQTIKNRCVKTQTARLTQIALATSVVLAGLAAPAHAIEIDTGNDDVTVRWDNQIRYGLGMRVEGINPAFANNPQTDATELSAKKGGVIMNRADLLSEVDVVYKGNFGGRVSVAAWNDMSMSKDMTNNTNLGMAQGNLPYQLSGESKRYLVGPSGEFMDAFVFGKFDAGSVPVNLKLGKHVTYWGEGLFNLFHSISYSQAPLDLRKAAASPGIDAKEVFLPINQLSAQAQLSDDLSFGYQYMLDWKAARLPPGGTYFGNADIIQSDSSPALFPFSEPANPSKKSGQFGANLRWSPQGLGGTAGVYYRKFNEVMPWGFVKMNAVTPQNLHFAYAKDTELYGVSFTSNLNGVNVGSELSMRKNTALISGATPLDASVYNFQGVEGARGDTMHFLVNSIYVLPKTPLFDGGSLQAEFVYSRLDKVTSNPGLFNGEGTTQCATTASLRATDIGCATKDYYGIQLGGNFDYPQVFPGVNMSVPFSVSYGLKGNAAIPGGGNEGAASWSLGVTASYLNKHNFSLKYNDSHVRNTVLPNGTVVQNGTTAIANNHAWVSFTYKTSF